MTLHRSSADSRANGAFFHPRFFLGEMKRSWYTGLLWSILLFFAYPVPIMLQFTKEGVLHALPERIEEWLTGYLINDSFIPMLAALGAGLLLSLVVMSCFFQRQRTHFVCGLPIRREAVLLSKTAAIFLWTVLAWLPSLLLVLITGLVNISLRPFLGLLFSGFLRAFLVFLSEFLYFCGAALLAASVCGTAGMCVFVLFLFIGYAPFLLFLISLYIQEFLPSFTYSYYVSEDAFSSVSAFARMFNNSTVKMPAKMLLFFAAAGLFYLVCAVLILRFRKSENAGSPFVFERVRSVVKYMLIVLVSGLMGFIFHGLGGFVWMLFGVLCGAVLCWMLCNTIFYKTPRMMFDAKRGILIASAVLLLLNAAAASDIFRLNSYVPSSAFTRSLLLDFGGQHITITDKELLKLFEKAAKTGDPHNSQATGMQNGNTGEKNIVASPSYIILFSVWKTRIGLPVARSIHPDYKALNEFSRALTAREDFAELYCKWWRDALSASPADAAIVVSFNPSDGSGYFRPENGYVSVKDFLAFLDLYESALAKDGADALQHPILGVLDCWPMDSSSFGGRCSPFIIPIFDNAEEVLLSALSLCDVRYADYISSASDGKYGKKYFRSASVIDNETGNYLCSISEKDFLAYAEAGYLNCSSQLQFFPASYSELTRFDYRYRVEFTYEERLISGFNSNGDPIETHISSGSSVLYFLEGKIPPAIEKLSGRE